MARSRNIKPGFFKNETLAELPPLARLLFIGTWCVADREGRLEDRPKRIMAEVLPYDDGDPDELLDSLSRAGFILRYQVNDQRLIQVLNFSKHQNPHYKEQASLLSAPGMPEVSPRQAPDMPGSCPAVAVLIPDSLNLIPDSLQKQRGEKSASPAHRGSRLPADWFLPDESKAWSMKELGWTADRCQQVAESFTDYFRSVSGSKGVRADWPATWRGWCRRETTPAPARRTKPRSEDFSNRDYGQGGKL